MNAKLIATHIFALLSVTPHSCQYNVGPMLTTHHAKMAEQLTAVMTAVFSSNRASLCLNSIGLQISCLNRCAVNFFLALMLKLICGFGFTMSTTNIIPGLINVMSYGWRLSDSVADNCIDITNYSSNHNPCVPHTS